MWVIFQDCQSVFDHLDKYVVAIVDDADILDYQRELVSSINGCSYEIHDVPFLQVFVKSDEIGNFFARKYSIWTRPHESMAKHGVPIGTDGTRNNVSFAISRLGVAESLQ